MDRVKNGEDFGIGINFRCRKKHHRYLIEFILINSCVSQNELAELLEVNPLVLNRVRIDTTNLPDQAAIKLVEIFCMLFSD